MVYLGLPFTVYRLLFINANGNANLNLDANLNKGLRRKADRIREFVMEVGNFGHNRDMSYYSKYPYVVRKCILMTQRFGDMIRHARIFPMDSLRFFPRIMWNGIRSAVRGEG